MATHTLDRMLRSWQLALRAGNKSPLTLQVYARAVLALNAYLLEHGQSTAVARITHHDIQGFLARMLETHHPSTVHTRYRGLNAFFGWLVDVEGVLASRPTERVKPPSVPLELYAAHASASPPTVRHLAALIVAQARFAAQRAGGSDGVDAEASVAATG